MSALIVGATLAVASASGQPSSESIAQPIPFLTSLVEIRNLFPGATLRRNKRAGLGIDDIVYLLYGKGVPGKIYLQLYDTRGIYRTLYGRYGGSKSGHIFYFGANAPIHQALVLNGLTWFLESPLPIEQLVGRYGKTYRLGKGDTYRYIYWENGIAAFVSNQNEGNVVGLKFYSRSEDLMWYNMPLATTRKSYEKAGSPKAPSPLAPSYETDWRNLQDVYPEGR